MKQTRRRIDKRALKKIIETAETSDKTPAEIFEELQESFKNSGLLKRVPSMKTVERIVSETRQLAGREEADPWGLGAIGEVHDIDESFVLSVIQEALKSGTSKWAGLPTKDEARWIERIRRVAPDLDPLRNWALARDYAQRYRDPELDTEALDTFLALGPWRSKEAQEKYDDLVARGRIMDVGGHRTYFLSPVARAPGAHLRLVTKATEVNENEEEEQA